MSPTKQSQIAKNYQHFPLVSDFIFTEKDRKCLKLVQFNPRHRPDPRALLLTSRFCIRDFSPTGVQAVGVPDCQPEAPSTVSLNFDFAKRSKHQMSI